MKFLLLGVLFLLNGPSLRSQDSGNVRLAYEYIKTKGIEPSQYILDKCSLFSIVLLGEDHGVRENLLFVAGLIPKLYRAGVLNIGMEFGASEDQEQLDLLVTADRYDERKARDIMFDYNVGWAYREYTNIYKAAWIFNRRLPRDAKKFRILNMSYIFDWSKFDGQRSPGTMKKVFLKGPIDTYRADYIEREVLNRGEKVLILTGTPHAYLKSGLPGAAEQPVDAYTSSDLGARLYKKYPSKVFSIILHQPFEIEDMRNSQLQLPPHLIIERAMKLLGNRPVGFDLRLIPEDPLTGSRSFTSGPPDLGLSRLFGGYIFLRPIDQLTGCTIDKHFFEKKSWENIMRRFPDPDWHKRPDSLKEYMAQIKEYVDLKKRYSHQDKR